MRHTASRGGAWLLALALFGGCNGNSVNGSVAGVDMVAEDGFYTELEWNGTSYFVVVLTDVEDACNVFRATEPDPGNDYNVLQLWITGTDPDSYSVYASSHLDEAVASGDPYGTAWYLSVINAKEVVNTDGVAGLIDVANFDYDDKVLAGSMDVIFSGNGNRLQGSFGVDYCELDWARVAAVLLEGGY